MEDFEVRAKINLFKDPEGLAQAAAAQAERDGAMVGGDDADDEAPEVGGAACDGVCCLQAFVTCGTGECG